jgi:hypothetical protein
MTTSRFLVEATACALAVALIFLAWTWPALSRGENTVDNAIIFLADTSASMDEDEKQTVRKSHATAISSPEVIDAILSGGYQRSVFAYVEFADNAVIVVDWTLIASQADAIAFADRITNGTGPKAKGSNTAIGSALAVAHELMQRLSYEALYRTVDVAGDGLSNYGAPVTIARSLLLDMGVTINGLPMTLRPDDKTLVEYYKQNVVGGPRSFSIELRDIADMPMLVRRKLLLEIG